jgi:DNA-binding transcriptional LysR family regulator
VHVRPDHIIRRRAHLITAALTPELKRPALRTLPSTTFLTPRCVADDAKVLVPKGSFRTNDAEEIRAAVLTDPGLAHAPGWLFARELASDAVRLVLRDESPWDLQFLITPDATGSYGRSSQQNHVPTRETLSNIKWRYLGESGA